MMFYHNETARKITKLSTSYLELAGKPITEFRLLGERLKFGITGRPDPSEAVLLAGSGRSGTTWLANMLVSSPQAQLIFEPLAPRWNKDVRRLTGWDRRDPYFRSVYLPSNQVHPEWKQLLAQVLTGRYRNIWTDFDRNSWFPDWFLIKEIWANLMLGFIYSNFRPRIIYIVRHPCAVVYSRLNVTDTWYANVADLLCQEQLVEDYLRPHLRYIERERDLLGAHAVWWSVENYMASLELLNCPHYFVKYEELCFEPEEEIKRIINWLGFDGISPRLAEIIYEPSRVSHRDTYYSSQFQRIAHWKKGLTEEHQRRILEWAYRFGIRYYNNDILPVDMQCNLRSNIYMDINSDVVNRIFMR